MKIAKYNGPVLVVLLLACAERQTGDDSDGPPGMVEWSPCVNEGEVETCADACAAEGMVCVANGCPVDPAYCGIGPVPCDMATQARALDTSVFCTDASVGVFFPSACEDPIFWLGVNTARCCCARDD